MRRKNEPRILYSYESPDDDLTASFPVRWLGADVMLGSHSVLPAAALTEAPLWELAGWESFERSIETAIREERGWNEVQRVVRESARKTKPSETASLPR